MPHLVTRSALPVAEEEEEEDVEYHLSYKLRRDGMEDEGGAYTEVVANAAALGRSRLVAPSPAHLDSRSKKWPTRLCSMLCCIVLMTFVAFLLAIVYIIFKDLSWEKENREADIKTGILGQKIFYELQKEPHC
ncbi:ADP-ribosylation factor-like protein 6-interacting protein 6 isoform X2 [Rhinoraja longicauda]